MPVLPRVEPTPRVTRRRTRAEEVADQLREEIISGQLGGGAVLAEIPTSERLAVSRVPVREATLVLEREGLLVFDGRGRCRVRSLTARDLNEIYDVRLMLERECFRLAAVRRTAQQLRDMDANIEHMASARTLAHVTLLDIEFHDLIVEAADHSRWGHLWRMMRGQIQLFTASVQRDLNEVTSAVRESSVIAHRECLEVIRAQREDAAATCATKHLRAARRWLLAKRRDGSSS